MQRDDFPLINSNKYIYFDNAATMQKPRQVLDAVRDFYEAKNANPLRGIYDLSVQAEEETHQARQKVADFIGATSPEEIIFTRNATEGLNMAAWWIAKTLTSDDEILIGQTEHHSNLLPWARIANETGAHFGFIPGEEGGKITAKIFEAILTPNVKVVTLSLMGNVFGNLNEVAEISKIAHQNGVIVVVDAAQAVAHLPVSVADLGADFLVFSGHKIGAPMGIGVLWGKKKLLNQSLPILLGGGMVKDVSINRHNFGFTLQSLPAKYEAGTQNIGGIVGLGAAIDYWRKHDAAKLWQHEQELTQQMVSGVKELSGVELIGAGQGIVSFKMDKVHPHDIAQCLADENICVRAGYHCAQPGLDLLGIGPVVRASLSFYNTEEEVDKFLKVLGTVRQKMGVADV